MKKYIKATKHLLEYGIFIIFIKLLQPFGIDRAAQFCSILARKIGPLLPVTKIASKNLCNVFGSSINHNEIINKLWDNFGRFIGEFAFIKQMPESEILRRVEIIGLEHLEAFKKYHIPFLLFSGHFANWDLPLKLLNKLYPKFGVIYRQANNPYINKVINNYRQNDNLHLIAKGPKGVKDLIKSIKSGYSIVMMVDQKMNDGIKVPFFSKPAMTPSAIAKFALQFSYPIVPLQIIRSQGSYFQVIIHPPLEFVITDDSVLDCYNIMLQINQILESWIRQRPEQWLWFHNRWS